MTPDTVNMWTNLIANVGFPIFVAVYLLVSFSKTLKANTDMTSHLANLIQIWITTQNPPSAPSKPPGSPNSHPET